MIFHQWIIDCIRNLLYMCEVAENELLIYIHFQL